MTQPLPAVLLLLCAALLLVTVSPRAALAQTSSPGPVQDKTRPATIGSAGTVAPPATGSPTTHPAQPVPRTATVGSTDDKAPAPELVAVLDLEGVDATKGQASAMTDRLREELLRTGKFALVNRDQMDQVFKEQAFQQSVCTTPDCAAKAGKVLGIRKIVAGRVTKLDEKHWLLTLNLIDVETGQTIRAETQRYDGDFFGVLGAGIEQITAKLAGESPIEARRPPPGVRVPEYQQPPMPQTAPAPSR